MATGIPKKINTLSNGSVSLIYRDKTTEDEIQNVPLVSFDEYHSSPSGKRLYFGDNLDVLRALVDDPSICGKVNLIYIDPPFATQSQFLSRKQSQAYDDMLCGAAFVEFLRKRLILLHRLLSNNGSIYIHLDEKMIFEMKIIMDEVFGAKNYRNMIVRKKCNPKNYTRKTYGNIADFILFYSKTDKYIWNKQTVPLSEESKKEYQYIEGDTGRKYMKVPVHAPGTRNGETGKQWRGKMPPPGKHWQYTPKLLDEMDARGEIFWSKNGNPRRKVYLDQHPGVGVQDIWLDYRDAHNQNIKITGYPTEKNPELFRRIIAASSNPGDMVLDCFAGSGTTLAVADEMQRNWVGVDNSVEAIKTILRRFEHGLQAMGDFVKKKTNRKNNNHMQQTLFDSLEDDTSYAPSSPNPTHMAITDFSLFLSKNSPNKLHREVDSWFQRNNGINDSSAGNVFSVSESNNYADITYYLHKQDKQLAKIINDIGPCTLTLGHDGFEFLADAIISQKLSKSVADSIIKRLRDAFPKGKLTPKTFLEKDKKYIKAFGISERKYEYIFDLCTKINSKILRLPQLQTESDDTIRNELKKVNGIGDWTVDMYLLFGLARLDIFPVNDFALRKIICKVYKVQPEDEQSIMKISDKWQPYRSVGSWYLYRHGNENA